MKSGERAVEGRHDTPKQVVPKAEYILPSLISQSEQRLDSQDLSLMQRSQCALKRLSKKTNN